MLASIIISAIAALFISGLAFRHQRVLTYIGAAGALWEGFWLIFTLIDRAILPNVESNIVYLVGSIVVLICSLFYYRRWTFPYKRMVGSGRRDLVVLTVLLIVGSLTYVVSLSNGFTKGDPNTFIMNGFYNGDTVTLASLTQQAFEVSGLPDKNPFAADTSLEYPTLLHASLATLLAFLGIGFDWIAYLPVITLVQTVFLIGTFFLLWDVMMPEPEDQWEKWLGASSRMAVLWLQGLIVLYVMAVSWDNYIYPQSHFFLNALFLLIISFLVKNRFWLAIPLTLVLMMSNAVMGAASVGVILVYFALQAGSKSRKVSHRGLFLLGIFVWLGLFVWLAPGEASFGILQFSYSAAEGYISTLPVMLVLIGSIWVMGRRHKLIAASAVTLIAMGFLTLIFSDRNIVVENSSRFAYHGLMIAFPLTLPIVIRLYYLLKYWLLRESHSWDTRLVGLAGLVFGLMLLGIPAGVGVLKAHDNTMFLDHQEVTLGMRATGWWITENTPYDAKFVVSPEEPWHVPLLTGRLQVRTDDYWLSPQDDLLVVQNAAFAGDNNAQMNIVEEADYLLLTDDELKLWEPLPYERVTKNDEINLYRLR